MIYEGANGVQALDLVGRKLLDLVNSVPKMSPDEFDKMVNSNMKASLTIKLVFNRRFNVKFCSL